MNENLKVAQFVNFIVYIGKSKEQVSITVNVWDIITIEDDRLYLKLENRRMRLKYPEQAVRDLEKLNQ